jgi:hypothetical protein
MAKSRRTTHRSSAGKKLYAVRDASGKFKDIQTYERAHRQDLKTTSAGERSAAAKKSRKTAKKSAKKR